MTDLPERIVFVDDEPAVRAVLRRALEETGQELALVTCSGGQELLTRYRELQPDLILLDLKMSKMSGPDVVTALRARPESERVPIIFITGTRVVMTDEYKELGVIGVIHKPLDVKTLASQISQMWRAHQADIIKAV